MAANQLATPVLAPEAELAGAPFEQEQAVYEQPSLISRFVERVDAARDSITSSPFAYKLGALGASAVTLAGVVSLINAETASANTSLAEDIQDEIVHEIPYPGPNDINPANKTSQISDDVVEVNGKCSKNPIRPVFKSYKITVDSEISATCDGEHGTSHIHAVQNKFEDPTNRIGGEAIEHADLNSRVYAVGSPEKIKSNGKNAVVILSRPEGGTTATSTEADSPTPVRKLLIRRDKIKPVPFGR